MKKIIISLILIILLLVTHKNFANNNQNLNNIYFGYYNGNEKLEEMPQKDNTENLVFDYAICDNEAYVEWNEEEWAPLVKNLSKSKTKCSVYFRNSSGIEFLKKLVKNNDSNLIFDGTSDNNLRYIGENPNNYIDIGNKDSNGKPILWRIIGVMNNIVDVDEKTGNDNIVRSHIKLIRNDSLGEYSWDSSSSTINDGIGVNEWSNSAINKVLNNDFINRTNLGNKCYVGTKEKLGECPDWENIGLNENIRNIIANVKWNTGTFQGRNSDEWLVNNIYNAERSNHTGNELCKSNGGGIFCNDNIKRNTFWIGKVGLIYPSDYGFATSGGEENNRIKCMNNSMNIWNLDNLNFCNSNDWLYNSQIITSGKWTITPVNYENNAVDIFCVRHNALNASNSNGIYHINPVIYLNSNVNIIKDNNHDGSEEKPYIIS